MSRMTDVPPTHDPDDIRLNGPLLGTARSLVVTCVLGPATDVAVEDPEGPAAAEAEEARAVLDRIGWPGDPVSRTAVRTEDLDLVRSAAVAGLGAAAGEVDEAAAAVVHGGGRWDGDAGLEDLERIVGLLDTVGWPGGSRRSSSVRPAGAAAGEAPTPDPGPEALLVVGRDGTILAANRSFCALTGFAAEELVGVRPPYPHWHEEDREQLTAAARGFVGSDARPTTFMRYRRRDGGVVHVRNDTLPIPDAGGRVVAHAVLVRDERAARAARGALRAADERFRDLCQGVPVQMVMMDPAGRITFANRAAAEFLGPLPGLRDILPRVHPDDRDAAAAGLEAALAEQRAVAREMRVRGPGGAHHRLTVSLTPWTDGPDGPLLGFLGTAVDLSGGAGHAACRDVEDAAARLAGAVAGGAARPEVLALIARETAGLVGDGASVVVGAPGGATRVAASHGERPPRAETEAGVVAAPVGGAGPPRVAILHRAPGTAAGAGAADRVARFAVLAGLALAAAPEAPGATGDRPLG